MKRLLRIGSSLFIFTFLPVIAFMLLAVIFDDPNISTTYCLMYPMQFVWAVLKVVFATGANIKQKRADTENSVLSGIILGTLVGGLAFGICAIFIDEYIGFMKMSTELAAYKPFAIYSCLILFVQLIFSFILEKLFFEGKEKKANFHSLIFNIINFVVLIVTSLITKNQIIIVCVTLAVTFGYVIWLVVHEFKKFRYKKLKFDCNIFANMKYVSNTLCSYLFLFATYLFGFSNAFQAGTEFIIALNFICLVTDSQWDCQVAVSTAAQIDISTGNFNFKRSLKDSLLFTLVNVATSLVMFFSLYNLYEVDLSIGLSLLAFHIGDFFSCAAIFILETFVQLEHSATINTVNMFCQKTLRTILSIFLPTAYCTVIGQIVTSFTTLAVLLIICFSVFKLTKEGLFVRRKKEEVPLQAPPPSE
ncbi:MAG: hypothetical protein J6K39_00140 [Clostridia bacterium]|nr:hypothetical protein [Clostridia bacterium]